MMAWFTRNQWKVLHDCGLTDAEIGALPYEEGSEMIGHFISNRGPHREDKAARTADRLVGRSTIPQQVYLKDLGVPSDISITWTKDRADKEIKKRTNKNRKRNGYSKAYKADYTDFEM